MTTSSPKKTWPHLMKIYWNATLHRRRYDVVLTLFVLGESSKMPLIHASSDVIGEAFTQNFDRSLHLHPYFV